MSSLPKIATDTNPDILRHLAEHAPKMEGKTVKNVTFGIREHHKELHQSDVLLLEFTDGSILSIQTGSNAKNVVQDIRSGKRIEIDDFHTDFVLIWEDEDSEEVFHTSRPDLGKWDR